MKRLLIPISALFLAACGAANAPADAPVEVNSDTVLDDKLFQEATSGSSLAKCDEIADNTKKDECKMVVQSFLTTAEAVAKPDASLCKEITDGRYKEDCENRVKDTISEAEAYEKAKNEIAEEEEKIMTIGSEAMAKNDADLCNKIEDQKQKYSCRYNVLANQAIQLNDPSLCDQIGDEISTEQCKSGLQN